MFRFAAGGKMMRATISRFRLMLVAVSALIVAFALAGGPGTVSAGRAQGTSICQQLPGLCLTTTKTVTSVSTSTVPGTATTTQTQRTTSTVLTTATATSTETATKTSTQTATETATETSTKTATE